MGGGVSTLVSDRNDPVDLGPFREVSDINVKVKFGRTSENHKHDNVDHGLKNDLRSFLISRVKPMNYHLRSRKNPGTRGGTHVESWLLHP